MRPCDLFEPGELTPAQAFELNVRALYHGERKDGRQTEQLVKALGPLGMLVGRR